MSAKPQEFKPKPGWLERQGKNAEVTMAKIDEAFGRAEPAPQEPAGEAVAEAIKESRRQMGQCVKCGERPEECTCDPAAPQKENSDER